MSSITPTASDAQRFRARALASMYGAGGLLGLLAVLLPHGSGVNAVAWGINSTLGLPVCAGLLVFARRTPAWVVHGLLASAAAMVSLGLVFGGAPHVRVASSFLH